jgi:SAM-dependent methyltransferase
MRDPTARFSDRVADYVKYRPSYPPEAIDAILARAKPSEGARVADVGSGTGISAKLLLERGCEVIAIEPNAEMRAAAEHHQPPFPKFRSVDGTAENTGIEGASVELALAAQAFHWFKKDEARVELQRILALPKWCAIMWNERVMTTEFLRAYEAALHTHGIDYAEVNHTNVDRDTLARFFGGDFETLAFDNAQSFDREGLIGRALSSSYVPTRGHPKHDGMMRALEEIFATHARDGHVEFRYITTVHIGTIV